MGDLGVVALQERKEWGIGAGGAREGEWVMWNGERSTTSRQTANFDDGGKVGQVGRVDMCSILYLKSIW